MLDSQIKAAKKANKGLKGTVGDNKEVKFDQEKTIKTSGGKQKRNIIFRIPRHA